MRLVMIKWPLIPFYSPHLQQPQHICMFLWYGLEAPPIKRQNILLHSLNLGWPSDLFDQQNKTEVMCSISSKPIHLEILQLPLSSFCWESCGHYYRKEPGPACWKMDTRLISPYPQLTASHLPDVWVRPSTASWLQTYLNLVGPSRRTTQLIAAYIANPYNYAL